MRAHVLTRGRRRQEDYAYFPQAPEKRWWEEYGECADFDYPVLLVEAGDGRWRAYVGGVPTSRDDVTGTPIRLSLALEGSCGEEPGTAFTASLIEERAGDQAGAPTAPEAAACLDRVFDEEAVAGLFADRCSAEALLDAAVQAYASSAVERPGTSSSAKTLSGKVSSLPEGSWVAALCGEEARAGFHAHVRALLAGTVPGRALLLNSLGRYEEVPRPRSGERLIVLADSAGERFRPDPVAIQGKASARAVSARASGWRAWTPAAAAGCVAVAVLAWRVCSRRRRLRGRTPRP
ncbi:hypothetical protein [Streptomyces hiroshimensis]|uniref:Uncharacterized protein n=1 Tax=Streptomyces hiroshimensis TaxID=66424 RepID=A0ABQ2YLT5_9ACTN|nr:hypothetical protein [Streptomyces hiroshimensis]GGX88552.1 hypothetical protein GCM10010324_37920 [Streptomyces hiroshimensis]